MFPFTLSTYSLKYSRAPFGRLWIHSTQHVEENADVGGTSADGNLFRDVTGKGLQVGLSTIAGYGLYVYYKLYGRRYEFGGSMDLFFWVPYFGPILI